MTPAVICDLSAFQERGPVPLDAGSLKLSISATGRMRESSSPNRRGAPSRLLNPD
jgi:hypothetical protein